MSLLLCIIIRVTKSSSYRYFPMVRPNIPRYIQPIAIPNSSFLISTFLQREVQRLQITTKQTTATRITRKNSSLANTQTSFLSRETIFVRMGTTSHLMRVIRRVLRMVSREYCYRNQKLTFTDLSGPSREPAAYYPNSEYIDESEWLDLFKNQGELGSQRQNTRFTRAATTSQAA